MNILITGTSKGLGYELANLYLARGDKVIGISRSAYEGKTHANYTHLSVDVADEEALIASKDSIGFDHIDLLINNASIPGRGIRIETATNSEIQKLLDVSLFGTLNVCRTFMPLLKKASRPFILNISSRFGSMAYNLQSENKRMKISYAYRISKAALNMATICLANEFDSTGMKFRVIHPGEFVSATGRPEAVITALEQAQKIQKWLDHDAEKSELELIQPYETVFGW